MSTSSPGLHEESWPVLWCTQLDPYIWTLRQQTVKEIVNCLSGKEWRRAFLLAPSVLVGSVGIVTLNAHEPIKDMASLFSIVLWVSWTYNHWLSELGVSGPVSWQPLKAGVLNVWSKSSLLTEKLGVGDSLLIVRHCAGVVFMERVVSAFPIHFSVCSFLAAWISLRAMTLCVSGGGGKFRSFLPHHRGPSN